MDFNPAVVEEASLIEAVKNAGYAVKDKTSEPGGPDDLEKVRQAKSRMKIAWAFTVPLMVWMLVKIITGSAWPNSFVYKLGMLLLALPVLLWPGWQTFRSAIIAAIHKNANMDVLIAMGKTASNYYRAALIFHADQHLCRNFRHDHGLPPHRPLY